MENILKEIEEKYKNIQEKENTTNALDFINEIIENLQRKYRI